MKRRLATTDRHLIDIETATPCSTASQVATALLRVRRAVSDFDEAQVRVAYNHRAARGIAFSIPNVRHLWRSGPNGADLALVRLLEAERVEERFTRLTLCSGDGIFADAVARLGLRVEVTVVALRGCLSRMLRLAATRVHELPPPIEALPGGEAS